MPGDHIVLECTTLLLTRVYLPGEVVVNAVRPIRMHAPVHTPTPPPFVRGVPVEPRAPAAVREQPAAVREQPDAVREQPGAAAA